MDTRKPRSLLGRRGYVAKNTKFIYYDIEGTIISAVINTAPANAEYANT